VAKSRKNINKGVTLYNKILKEFTKINNDLPEDRKLSLADRRKYIKEVIYPQYKGTSPSRVGKKAIGVSVFKVLETIVPKEGCDVNYISPSAVSDVSWFDIDEFIRDVLPKCIFIRVDAGDFGTTKIFNTLNYDFTKSGVKKIYDNIREAIRNTSNAEFTGVKKLRNGKANDGTPENYFIDFILTINSRPIKPIEPIIYNVPREERRKVTTVKNAILSRLKDLGNKKKRRTNARKTARKNIKEIKKLKNRQTKAKTEKYKRKIAEKKIKEYNKAIKQLQNALNRGNLTPEQYDKFEQEINNLITDALREGGML
jgi:hypothetical protein